MRNGRRRKNDKKLGGKVLIKHRESVFTRRMLKNGSRFPAKQGCGVFILRDLETQLDKALSHRG